SAKADMKTMVKKGYLEESEKHYEKLDMTSYIPMIKPRDQKILNEVVFDYGSMSRNALIKHTYLNFPFYAIHSTIVHEVLSGNQFERVEKAIPKDDQVTLFTIGYEGISLEKYLQKLIRNNVKLLVDVRRNPLSMKFGFSKTRLKQYCNSVGVEYIHIPEVGISSDKRHSLKNQSDYDKLFENYRNTTLKETINTQEKILDFLENYKRITLTCFEAEPCQCHRTHLASVISELPGFEYPSIHL